MHHELTVLPTFIPLWRRWDSNPRPSECKSDALAKLSYNPKFSHTIAGLSAPKRLIKTMSRKHPKSQQPICTSLGFFLSHVWVRVALGENYDISTYGLTVRCSASELPKHYKRSRSDSNRHPHTLTTWHCNQFYYMTIYRQ